MNLSAENVSLADLPHRFQSRDAVVGVMGLGYVGLPVALRFAEAGFTVLGLDVDTRLVDGLVSGRSHIHDVPDERVAAAVRNGSLRPTTSYEDLGEADAILICLPTPLLEGAPDLSTVLEGVSALRDVLKRPALVILESTTYPGTTEDVVRPLLESAGRKVASDVLLAYSPERIDPGNETFGFEDIPKVVGGIDELSTAAAAALYEQVVPKVIRVSTPKEAELSKLIENTFRHVNIALINELAVYARDLGIDIWEAIEAAASKPFGFVPFYPGPGWGGHCIPLDPAYLSWRVRREHAHEVRFVELAHRVNSEMPRYVTERVTLSLNGLGKAVSGSRLLVIGAAYKGGTEDTRESPALRVIRALSERGAHIDYHDPLVSEISIGGSSMRSIDIGQHDLPKYDLVLILVPQVGVDWDLVRTHAARILDCCNALNTRSEKIERL